MSESEEGHKEGPPKGGSQPTKGTSGEEEVTLIDAESNVYVLAKPHDFTAVYEDPAFLKDMLIMWIVALFLGYAFKASFDLPMFLGYIFAGISLGPSGFNWLRHLVKICTISQLGVLLMLFTLGLEFHLDKVKAIWRVSVVGGLLFVGVLLLVCICVFFLYGKSFQEGLVIGLCLALSSTSVIVQ